MCQIFVKALDGKMHTFVLELDTSVKRFRKLIAIRLEMPLNRLRLVYGGNQMYDAQTLKEAGLIKECSVHALGTVLGD
jgi:hypothetical protein